MVDYYVDPNIGDDTYSGLDGFPWETIRYAVGELSDGDTLYLASTTDLDPATSPVIHDVDYGILSSDFATVASETTVTTEGGEYALVTANAGGGSFFTLESSDNWTFENLRLDARGAPKSAGMRFRGSTSNIILRNIFVNDIAGSGFRWDGTTHNNVLAEDCTVDCQNYGGLGPRAWECWSVPSNVGRIDNCTLIRFTARNWDHQAIHVRGDNWTITDPVIHDGGGKAIGIGVTSGETIVGWFATNVVVEGGLFYRIGNREHLTDDESVAHGAFSVAAVDTANITIRKCVFWNIDGAIFQIVSDVDGPVYLYGNTCYGWQVDYADENNHAVGAIDISEKAWAQNQSPIIVARNNILYGVDFTPYTDPAAESRWWHIPVGCDANLTMSNNLYFGDLGNTGTVAKIGAGNYSTLAAFITAEETDAVNSDPLLTALPFDETDGPGDATLLDGSPAFDAGVDVGLPYEGSAPDIGAGTEGGAQNNVLPGYGDLTVTGSVISGGGQFNESLAVSASENDASETAAGSASITRPAPVLDTDGEYATFRFLPSSNFKNSTSIISATLGIYLDNSAADDPYGEVWGIDTDNVVPFTNGTNTLSVLPTTSAVTAFNDTSQTSGYYEIDVTDQVQEIVDRVGYAATFAVGLILRSIVDGGGAANFQIRMFDYDAPVGAWAATLDVVGTNLVTVTGAAVLAGTGAISADVTAIVPSTSVQTGTGGLSAASVVIVTGSATLSGMGGQSAAGLNIVTGIAILSGTGDLSPAALVIIIGAGVLTGSGDLSADIVAITSGAAVLTASGGFAASSTVLVLAAATLSGTGALASTSLVIVMSSAAPAGAGSMVAFGIAVSAEVVGRAVLSGIGALSETSLVTTFGAAILSGTGGLSCASLVIVPATVTMSASGDFSAAVIAIVPGAGSLTAALGGLSATPTNILPAAALLSAAGTMFGSELVITVGAGVLTGSGDLSAAPTVTTFGQAAFSGAGGLSVASTLIISLAASLSASGGLTATGRVLRPFSRSVTVAAEDRNSVTAKEDRQSVTAKEIRIAYAPKMEV